MADAAEILRDAQACLAAGRLEQAQSAFEQLTALEPRNPAFWNALGIVAYRRGRLDQAIAALRKAIELQPRFEQAFNHLGLALKGIRQYEEAGNAFAAALAIRSGYWEPAYNMGLMLEQNGELALAERAYRMALAAQPDAADALCNLGNLLRREARPQAAEPFLRRAAELRPRDAVALGNLALLRLDLGDYEEASKLAQRAASLAPDEALWWETAGTAARLLPDPDAAVPLLDRARTLAPGEAGTLFELALALEACAEDALSLEAFAAARRIAPGWEKLRWAEALHLPAIPESQQEAARALERFDAGLERVVQGLRLDTADAVRHAMQAALACMPFNLHYLPGDHCARQERFANLVAKVARAAMPAATATLARRTRREGERLRVGFVSGYLRTHVVARFFARSITGLDGRAFERWAWSTGGSGDAVTDEIARGVEHFEASTAPVASLAEHIRAAALDVLVFPDVGLDPMQGVLASLRLAPVQAAFFGHPVTTGIDTVDFFLSGEALEPEGADAHYRERLVRLPGLGAQPRAPAPAGDGSWARALRAQGRPLFLCAQNLMKIPPHFDATLAQVAASTGARLVFFDRGAGVSRRFSQRLARAFCARGADPDRQLRIEPLRPYADFLAGLAEADLVLDTPGFSGGATSLDALGVGAAVLCFEGERARARQTSAMLRLIGVDASIARDAEDYAARAASLADDPALRAGLRARISAGVHVLFDDPRPIEGFAAFLRGTTPS